MAQRVSFRHLLVTHLIFFLTFKKSTANNTQEISSDKHEKSVIVVYDDNLSFF